MATWMYPIHYSDKYYDDNYEYKHVVIPREVAAKILPKNRLLTEDEWRAIGVQQSPGWVNYAIHRPEPHIILFRRPLILQETPPEGLIWDADSSKIMQQQQQKRRKQ